MHLKSKQHTLFPHINPMGIIFKLSFIQRSQYIRPKVTVNKCVGIIRMQVLFEGGPYMRKYGMSSLVFLQG